MDGENGDWEEDDISTAKADILLPIEDIFDTRKYIGTHIISKEEMEKDVSLRGKYLLQQFFRAGTLRSLGNNLMMRLYFHTVMGAYLNDYIMENGTGTIDLRVPIIWIQDSGSGKSQMNRYAIDVCKKLGLQASSRTEITTAGIIGTFDQEKHKHNIKHNLSPDNQSIIKGTSTYVYQSPVNKGDLGNHDIIIMDEGKIILQPGGHSQHTENLLSILQPALEYPGLVSKKMAAKDPIEYPCKCTLIVTTVPVRIPPQILEQGFYQRFILYSRQLRKFDQHKMQHEANRGKYSKMKREYDESITNIADAIQKHSTTPIARGEFKVRYTEETEEECLGIKDHQISMWDKKSEIEAHGEGVKALRSFVSRMSSCFIDKIASQMAVLNGRKDEKQSKISNTTVYRIEKEDVLYSIEVLDEIFNKLAEFVMSLEGSKGLNYTKAQKIIQYMDKMKKDENGITETEFIKIVGEIFNEGRVRATAISDELINESYFIRDHLPRKTGKLILPNWDLWIKKTKK